MEHGEATYDDGNVALDGDGILIRRYYPWGAKRIGYRALRGVQEVPLTGPNRMRRWRIWGSGDFVHWWNLDRHRPSKRSALVLDVGRRIRPTITPDDPQTVSRILGEHLSA